MRLTTGHRCDTIETSTGIPVATHEQKSTMCRTETRLAAAERLAYDSEGVREQRLGAMIYRSGSLIGSGVNSRTNPGNLFADGQHINKCSVHAEISAIRQSSYEKLQGADMYVARITWGFATRSMAKPCGYCMPVIANSGIARVYYTTAEGYAMINIRAERALELVA